MIQFLAIMFGYGIGCFTYENVRWFIVRKYYNRKNYNDKKAIIKTNSLIAYSYAITTFNKDGYKLKFDDVMSFNPNKYRAILIKTETVESGS
jgi:uncharacterized protein YxeA